MEEGVYMCHHCQKISPENKRCSSCKSTWYCDIQCQREDWPQHRLACKALSSEPQEQPEEDSNGTLLKTLLVTTGIVALAAGVAYYFGRSSTSDTIKDSN